MKYKNHLQIMYYLCLIKNYIYQNIFEMTRFIHLLSIIVCSYWSESDWRSSEEGRSNTFFNTFPVLHSKCSGYCRWRHVLARAHHHSARPFAEQIAGLASDTRPCLNRLILHRHQPNQQEITQSQTWKYHQFWAAAVRSVSTCGLNISLN